MCVNNDVRYETEGVIEPRAYWQRRPEVDPMCIDCLRAMLYYCAGFESQYNSFPIPYYSEHFRNIFFLENQLGCPCSDGHKAGNYFCSSWSLVRHHRKAITASAMMVTASVAMSLACCCFGARTLLFWGETVLVFRGAEPRGGTDCRLGQTQLFSIAGVLFLGYFQMVFSAHRNGVPLLTFSISAFNAIRCERNLMRISTIGGTRFRPKLRLLLVTVCRTMH